LYSSSCYYYLGPSPSSSLYVESSFFVCNFDESLLGWLHFSL
jgi:hypothetical protein